MPWSGSNSGGEGHARRDGPLGLRLVIFDDILAGAVVNAGEADVGLSEEGGQPLKIGLLPRGERVIVALGAIETQPKKGPSHTAGQSHRVRLIFLILLAGNAHEIGRGFVGPQAVVGDQVADNGVIGPVLSEAFLQPRDKPAATIKDERPVLGADVGACQTLGEVIGEAAVLQEVVEPPG